jgi:hypothetical protein
VFTEALICPAFGGVMRLATGGLIDVAADAVPVTNAPHRRRRRRQPAPQMIESRSGGPLGAISDGPLPQGPSGQSRGRRGGSTERNDVRPIAGAAGGVIPRDHAPPQAP